MPVVWHLRKEAQGRVAGEGPVRGLWDEAGELAAQAETREEQAWTDYTG